MQLSSTPAVVEQKIQPTHASGSRLSRIDVLRGLSIIAVVIHHITLRIPLQTSEFAKYLPTTVVKDLRWNGYNGVVVFFTISGFLITRNCLRRWGALSSIDVRRFYRMRVARIAPCLFALLAILSLLHLARVHPYEIKPQVATLPRALTAALTLHVNWLEAHRGYLPANWDVLWSLCNEEVFYILFPLVCVLFRKRIAIICVLVTFLVVEPFARVLTQNEIWSDYAYLSCMGIIAAGCLGAIAEHARAFAPRTRVAMKWGGAAMAAFITLYRGTLLKPFIYRFGLDVPILALGCALILVACAQDNKIANALTAPFEWFGRNSYEIYLTHMFVVFTLLPLAQRFDASGRWIPVTFGVMVGVSGLVGAAISRYFSEPMNRRLRGREALAASQPRMEPTSVVVS